MGLRKDEHNRTTDEVGVARLGKIEREELERSKRRRAKVANG